MDWYIQNCAAVSPVPTTSAVGYEQTQNSHNILNFIQLKFKTKFYVTAKVVSAVKTQS